MTKNDKTSEALEKLEAAIESIQTSEQFASWLRVRGKFRTYSPLNTFLIWAQCPNATLVAGFRKWQSEFERQVRKGEKGIMILAPRTYKQKETDPKTGASDEEVKVYFRAVHVFDVSQTDGKPIPEPPLPVELKGDSLGVHLPALDELIQSIGFTLSSAPTRPGTLGTCNYTTKEIRLDRSVSVNQQVCVLIHELVHALGAASSRFGKSGAETIAESAAFLVACSLGVDSQFSSAPYVACFSTPQLRREAIDWIEHYASTIEHALGLIETPKPAPKSAPETAADEEPELIAA